MSPGAAAVLTAEKSVAFVKQAAGTRSIDTEACPLLIHKFEFIWPLQWMLRKLHTSVSQSRGRVVFQHSGCIPEPLLSSLTL